MTHPKGAKNVGEYQANRVIEMLRIGTAQKKVADFCNVSRIAVKTIVRCKKQTLETKNWKEKEVGAPSLGKTIELHKE